MERKRKLPARASRTEHVSKKRLTPPQTPAESPAPPAPAPPTVIEEVLPKKIEAGKALPTVDEPQAQDLPSKDFQSVSESGVLTESLHRSRQKWLSEGIFEKYWTKPVKKKGVTDLPANNPAKDTMTKLGHVTITVEPHLFEATMYAIKDNTPRPPIPQNPMYRPIIQYGPPDGMMPPPAPTPTPPIQQRPIATPQTTPQVSKTEDVHMSNSGLTPPSNTSHTLNGPQPNGALPNGPPSANPTPRSAPSNPPPNVAPPPAGRGTDPVIQMLAERAATDPELKALMRIVANGEASHSQLKNFQSHIDDLTRLQKARQAAIQASQPSQPPAPPAGQAIPQINGNTTPRPAQAPAPPAAIRTNPNPMTPATKSEYQQPQALRSKGPPPTSKSDILGVVFEFTGGNGDRYLFPKFSILEPIPGNQIVASFLIVRKGSSSDSPSYDPDLDYYQPITIRIQSSQPRQLDSLQKVVAPQEEVQRYMNDVMDKATRAEYVLLAMRLRKDTDLNHNSEKDDENKTEQTEPIVGWATTNSTPSATAKVKPGKKVPTEDEQFKTFISTVAAAPV